MPSGLLASTMLRAKMTQRLRWPLGRAPRTKAQRLCEDVQNRSVCRNKPRRLIAKIAWPPGEVFSKIGVLVTNLPLQLEAVRRTGDPHGGLCARRLRQFDRATPTCHDMRYR